MGDEVMSIPVPPEDDARVKAWKIAEEELKKTNAGKSQNGTGGASNGNTGQNSWMNSPFPYPSVNPAYGQFGGGWHPSSWTGQPPPPPPPSAVQVAYNQTAYNYQHQQQHQQNRNGYGRGRGGGGVGGAWNQKQQFQPFALNRKNNQGAFPHINNSFVPQAPAGQTPPPLMGIGRGRGMPMGVQQRPAPPAALRYMQRAFEAANTAEDKEKTEEYLRRRLHPMLNAGNAHMVNWDAEPLPHERNYEVAVAWTPAKQLPNQANGFTRKKTSSSPLHRNDDETKRARRESDVSSDSDDQIEILHFSTNQKKTKSQKKAEKAAKKAAKKQKNLQQQQKAKNTWKVDGGDTEARREDRARRFAETLSNVSKPSVSVPQHFFRRGQIIRGTCQNIEKSFFRLTAAPDPAAVRPLEVLRLSLENVRNKYRERCEYSYLTSQMRSIRQDLTVQRIRNQFTVEVYEVNARISLENADREEFNKCQSQLKLLYSELDECVHHAEFIAYRLLYYIAMDNQIDVNSLLTELTEELKGDECVQFALKVRKAVTMNNYVAVFKLFKNAPKMCPYIMDMFIDREKRRALSTIIHAYNSLSFKVMAGFLQMEEEEFVDWLVEDLKWPDVEVGAVCNTKSYRSLI